MFGPVSFTIRSRLDDGVVEAEVMPPSRLPPRRLDLRLRVPVTRELQNVRVNGQEHGQVDVSRGTVSLSGLTGTVRVKATFAPPGRNGLKGPEPLSVGEWSHEERTSIYLARVRFPDQE